MLAVWGVVLLLCVQQVALLQQPPTQVQGSCDCLTGSWPEHVLLCCCQGQGPQSAPAPAI